MTSVRTTPQCCATSSVIALKVHFDDGTVNVKQRPPSCVSDDTGLGSVANCQCCLKLQSTWLGIFITELTRQYQSSNMQGTHLYSFIKKRLISKRWSKFVFKSGTSNQM